jgi:hypothetical protein
VPDILAHGNPENRVAEAQRPSEIARLKIAVFVKHVVGGQQPFSCLVDNGAATGNHDAVIQWFSRTCIIGLKTTEHHINIGQLRYQSRHGVMMVSHEGGTLQQIKGRIARHAELGKNGQTASAIGGTPGTGEDFGAIAGKITDNRVELMQRYFHGYRWWEGRSTLLWVR